MPSATRSVLSSTCCMPCEERHVSGSPWTKSSFSSGQGNHDCVEVAASGASTLRLRESDEPGTVLTLTPAALRSLLARARSGHLDSPSGR
ncbi:DUF397 domain-containing protein [Streptomyces mobaraensis]|uniref:DUF397 domain-containing protein n=1 Tax=Streptomyces mobaraensis TaxID=35621 RepID=UPI00331964AC